MKISRSRLVQIVKEEYQKIMEKGADVVDAHDDSEDKGSSDKPHKDPSNKAKEPAAKKDDSTGPAPKAKEELPAEEDPADDELEKDAEKATDDLESGKGIADDLVGKTIQSVTMNPKSKILPGAVEVEITFDQSPDPLKMLVTKSGQVKFFYKSSLHNEV